jgi:hypothetical protein
VTVFPMRGEVTLPEELTIWDPRSGCPCTSSVRLRATHTLRDQHRLFVGDVAVGETSTLEISETVSANALLDATHIASAELAVAETDIDPADDVSEDGILITSVVVGGPLPFTGAEVLALAVAALLLLGTGIVAEMWARARTRT